MLATAEQKIDQALGISPWVLLTRYRSTFSRSHSLAHARTLRPRTRQDHPLRWHLTALASTPSLCCRTFIKARKWPEDGRNPLNYGLDKVRILQPIIIGDGVRLRSHITLLDAQPKAGGDMLLKTRHDIEAEV